MKEQNKPLPQQGSGSAENTGQERSAQTNRNAAPADTASLSDEMGTDSQRLVSLHDLGSLSGRDDYAGGSGDDMEEESTGKHTIR